MAFRRVISFCGGVCPSDALVGARGKVLRDVSDTDDRVRRTGADSLNCSIRSTRLCRNGFCVCGEVRARCSSALLKDLRGRLSSFGADGTVR